MMTVVGVGANGVMVGDWATVASVFVGMSKLSSVFVATAAAAELVDVASAVAVGSAGVSMAVANDVAAAVGVTPPRTSCVVDVVACAAPARSVL